jgi:hypothetical protein
MKVWPAPDDLRLGAYAKGLTGFLILGVGLVIGTELRWLAVVALGLIVVMAIRLRWRARQLSGDIPAPQHLVVRSRREVWLLRVPLGVVEVALAPLILAIVSPQFLAVFGLLGVAVAVMELVEARAVERWERSHGGRLVRFGAAFAVV